MRIVAGTELKAPSQARLADFQRENGIVLPPDFISFVGRWNGARLATPAFNDGKRVRLVIRMLGLLDDYREHGPHGWADIEVVISQIGTRLAGDPNATYVTLVPIAELFAGDFLCLDFRRTPNAPSVAVWDHERSDDFRPVVDTIAGSFTAFTSLLFEPELAPAASD